MRSLMVAAALAAVSARASAGNPLDKPAFTATPQELLDAAKAAGAGDVTLRNEIELTFDDAGKLTRHLHYIAVAGTAESAAGWNQLWIGWQPWRQAKPQIRSRSIAATGEVHELDPGTLVDEPDRVGQTRHLRGTLVVAQGSIVEEESTTIDDALTPGGRGIVLELGFKSQMRGTRVTITAPAALKAKVVTRALPATAKLRHTKAGTRETWTYELADLTDTRAPDDVPLDVFAEPRIFVTLARSWGDVARAYGALVEPKLTMSLPPELHAGATIENARAITAWLHQHVTYSGVMFGLEPPDPTHVDEAVKRGSGSTGDLAILETALLRAAGIKADLVLVDRGPRRGGDPEQPNLDAFDHVLVRATIQGSESWIDPEDADAPVGQLRAADQGRPALAITGTLLVETPRAPAAANTLRVTRTFELPRIGFGNVTESSVETGELDRTRRIALRKSGARKELEADRNLRYGGELTTYSTTAPEDHAKPIEVTIAFTGATHLVTSWTHASAFVHPRDLFDQLPPAMRSKDAPVRTVDLEIAMPYVSEATTRIVVPEGVVVPAAQPDRKRAIGALTLVETQRLDGRTLIVTERLEVAKRRFTPAEVNETRRAIVALDFEHFVFANEAWSLVDHGKYREAVANMNATLAAQPRNALEHARFASILVAVGDGDGARREARKAVELAPKDADAHYALGSVLTYDLAGSEWAVGFDREGARTELALAHALAPKHYAAAHMLASVLERGTRGRLLGTGSDMHAAAEAWRAAYDVESNTTNAHGLLRALLWTGDAATAEAIAATMPPFDERDSMVVAAAAIARGPDAALRDTRGAARDKTVQAAASLLTVLRRYDLAKALLVKAAIAGSDRQREFVDKLVRFEPSAKRATDPVSVAFDYLAEQIDPGAGGAIFWDKETAKEAHNALRSFPIPPEAMLMTTPVMLDMSHSFGFASADGDANAWRVTLDFPGHKDIVYLAADHGVPKVIGFPASYAGIGRHVLRLMSRHDDAARRLLDWIARDMPRHAIRNVWSDALPKDTVHEILAASLLTNDPDREIAAGTACGMTTVEGANVCDQMVARGLKARGKWAELETYATAWIARAPAAYVIEATSDRAMALAQLGRIDELENLVDDTLAAHPDSAPMLFMRINVAVLRGQPDEIAKRADAAAKAVNNPGGENNIAWLEYIENVDTPGALERARKAFENAPKDGFLANTIAALEEASGDSRAAVEHMHAALDLGYKEAPSDADWYVLGRIYEDLGLSDDAITAYRRIAADKVADVMPTSYSLATARLRALGALKK